MIKKMHNLNLSYGKSYNKNLNHCYKYLIFKNLKWLVFITVFSVFFTPNINAQLLWNTNPVNLGDRCRGTNYTLQFSVTNTSPNMITFYVDDFTSTSQTISSITPMSMTLEAGHSGTFEVYGVFFPDVLGQINDYFNVSYPPYSSQSPHISAFVMKIPTAPFNLSASNITSAGCDLSWSCENAGKIYYDIVVVNGQAVATNVETKYKTLTNLASGTNYPLRVLSHNSCGSGGYSNTVNVLTKPAMPTNFKATNITYTGCTLSWNACTGTVTGYRIYDDNNNLLYTTTSNSLITSMCTGSTLKYKVCAYNNSGESNKTTAITVTTLSPTISGQFVLCSSSLPYTVNNLPTGYTVSWNKSSNLIMLSASGNTAFFKGNGTNGSGWIQATLTSGSCSKVLNLNIWTGIFVNPTISGQSAVCPSSLYTYTANVPGGHSSSYSYAWTYPSNWYNNGINQNMIILQTPSSPQYGPIRVSVTNACGASGYSGITAYPGYNCGGYFTIYPNPAEDVVNIEINEDSPLNALNDSTTNIEGKNIGKLSSYSVRVFNNQGILMKTQSRTGLNFSITIDNLEEGLYIIEISDRIAAYRQQLMIKRN